jgi:hypothetical protein
MQCGETGVRVVVIFLAQTAKIRSEGDPQHQHRNQYVAHERLVHENLGPADN